MKMDKKKFFEAFEKAEKFVDKMIEEGRIGELYKMVYPNGEKGKIYPEIRELKDSDVEYIKRDLGIDSTSDSKPEKITAFTETDKKSDKNQH